MRRQFAHCPQKSGSPSRFSRRQAIQSLRQHQRQRVLALPPCAGKNHRMRKPLPRQHIAQAMNSFGVAVKIRKHHTN
jgi:hypothetical protein